MENIDIKKQNNKKDKLPKIKRQKTIVLNENPPPMPEKLKEGDSILRYLPFTINIY